MRVISGWHRSIVPTTASFPLRVVLTGRQGAAGLAWLKAAQCEGCGGETRSLFTV
ncbi:hypothetical protein N8463_00575 [Synechococcus sp. AH-601-P06]|nr:hypothetical protein [Synechococcus sp. AH-601-P06]